MSFSLKYLFALVAVAAVFTAALKYRTPFWAFAAVQLSILVLLAGTFGVWLQRLNQRFWIPFCVVGWLYLALSLTQNGFAQYLPGKYVSYSFMRSEVDPILKRHKTSFLDRHEALLCYDNLALRRSWGSYRDDRETMLGFRRFVDIVDALATLIAGGIAGILTSILIRQERAP